MKLPRSLKKTLSGKRTLNPVGELVLLAEIMSTAIRDRLRQELISNFDFQDE